MNQSRINRVIENMKAHGLDQILVTATPSVYYLTGNWVNPGERMLALYLNADGETRLFANRLFALNGNTDVPLVEFDDTQKMFHMPRDKRTEDYITGRFG